MMRVFMLALLSLPMMAAAQTGTTPASAGGSDVENARDSRDRMICKRFTEIGSLIAQRKVCKTKHDWDQDRANLRMQNAPGQCPGGGQGGSCGG